MPCNVGFNRKLFFHFINKIKRYSALSLFLSCLSTVCGNVASMKYLMGLLWQSPSGPSLLHSHTHAHTSGKIANLSLCYLLFRHNQSRSTFCWIASRDLSIVVLRARDAQYLSKWNRLRYLLGFCATGTTMRGQRRCATDWVCVCVSEWEQLETFAHPNTEKEKVQTEYVIAWDGTASSSTMVMCRYVQELDRGCYSFFFHHLLFAEELLFFSSSILRQIVITVVVAAVVVESNNTYNTHTIPLNEYAYGV